MKKILTGLLSIILLGACQPLRIDRPMGGIVSEEDLQLEVRTSTPGGNEIIMTNNTPGVGSYWNYVIGVSTAKTAKAVLPFLGEQTITFTGFCDGGRVTTERKVEITQIDHEVDKEWGYFAGTEISGKHWVWNFEENDGMVYGTGGWLTEHFPSWDVTPKEELAEADCELVFDLNGGANMSKIDASGKVLEKGTFSFDMSVKKKNPDDGSIWSIGQLKLLGVSVMSGHYYWDEELIVSTFEILELTEDTMILCWAAPDTGAWDEGTFWCFRKK